MRVFELQASFQAEPPQEPEPILLYIVADIPDVAISRVKQDGAFAVKIVRELDEKEARRFCYLRSA
jgi:hypothetical protein